MTKMFQFHARALEVIILAGQCRCRTICADVIQRMPEFRQPFDPLPEH
jgi:hypothetical protein